MRFAWIARNAPRAGESLIVTAKVWFYLVPTTRVNIPLTLPPGASFGALGQSKSSSRLHGSHIGASWRHIGFILAPHRPILVPHWLILAHLGATLPHIGTIFGASCPILVPHWFILAPQWLILAPSWRHVGPSWRILAPHWPILALSWRHMDPSWRHIGSSWLHLGASWPVLAQHGRFLVPLRRSLAPHWRISGASSRHVASSSCAPPSVCKLANDCCLENTAPERLSLQRGGCAKHLEYTI